MKWLHKSKANVKRAQAQDRPPQAGRGASHSLAPSSVQRGRQERELLCLTINGAENTGSAQLMLTVPIINLDTRRPVSCYLRNEQVSLLLKPTDNILVIY